MSAADERAGATEGSDTRAGDGSTVEKTLVDCADHPEHCGGILELAKGLVNASGLDDKTLVEQLMDLGNGATIKRIVYLTDIPDTEITGREDLMGGITAGYSKLDPTQGDEGAHSSEYRLILNVKEETIHNVAVEGRSHDHGCGRSTGEGVTAGLAKKNYPNTFSIVLVRPVC